MGTIKITEAEAQRAQLAYAAFNTYATIDKDASLVMMPRVQQLQIKHHRWQARALPDNADTSLSTMAHGMTEEACWELPVAIEAGDTVEQIDAIGDLLVYTCAMCTLLRLDFNTLALDFDVVYVTQPEGEPLIELYKTLGQMNHIIGKHRQGTRGYDAMGQVREHAGAVIARMCSILLWMTYAQEWDLYEIFENTLNEVMKRNWKQNQLTGVATQPPLPIDLEIM